jgi:hypothetical protein
MITGGIIGFIAWLVLLVTNLVVNYSGLEDGTKEMNYPKAFLWIVVLIGLGTGVGFLL